MMASRSSSTERSYEVLEPARLTADAENPFWIDRSRAEAEEVSGDGQPANRATIRAEERMKLGAALAVTLMTTGLVTPTLTARDDGQRLLHFFSNLLDSSEQLAIEARSVADYSARSASTG